MNPKRHSESLAVRGNNSSSISVTGFVLPQSIGRFPEFRWGGRLREPRCPDFDNDCPNSGNRRSIFKTRRPESTSEAKDTTTTKNTDAATPYENVLTIQNAADLQWPAAAPANAGVRGEFLLGIFPPDHGGNHTPPPTPPAPTTAAK